MKLKFLSLCLLLALIVALALWALRRRQSASPSTNSGETTTEVVPDTTPKVTGTTGDRVDPEEAVGSQYSLKKLEEMAQRQGISLNVLTQRAVMQWSNAVQLMAGEVNRPVEFYGKAVDENGVPLQGASVEFGCIGFPESHFSTNALTDSRGLFSLNSVTGAILVVQVSKHGYQEMPGTNQNRFTYYSALGPSTFLADSNNPVVFRLQKVEVQRNYYLVIYIGYTLCQEK